MPFVIRQFTHHTRCNWTVYASMHGVIGQYALFARAVTTLILTLNSTVVLYLFTKKLHCWLHCSFAVSIQTYSTRLAIFCSPCVILCCITLYDYRRESGLLKFRTQLPRKNGHYQCLHPSQETFRLRTV